MRVDRQKGRLWGRPFFASVGGLALLLAACQEAPPLRFGKVTDAQVRGRCGECHMAYQPVFLPAASWLATMQGLADHFDEKVEIPPREAKRITDYLVEHAGDSIASREAGVALDGLPPNAAPLRLIETPYWRKAHSFMEFKLIEAWVGSKSRCVACHVDANSGIYDERAPKIPE